MARDFAKDFYESTAWKRVRDYIFKRDIGLCVICEEPGEIVHHKIPLTPSNISDVEIALGEDNLMLVCRRCHGKLHGEERIILFDSDGQPIPPCF